MRFRYRSLSTPKMRVQSGLHTTVDMDCRGKTEVDIAVFKPIAYPGQSQICFCFVITRGWDCIVQLATVHGEFVGARFRESDEAFGW